VGATNVFEPIPEKDEAVAKKIIGAAIEVHRALGPGFLDSIYQQALAYELSLRGIQVNPRDAERLGLRNGQQVRVVSATNPDGIWPLADGVTKPMIGKLVFTQTLRPGVISFALGFGHWTTGASEITIDAQRIAGEPRRAAGIHANAAMWIDPTLKNTCLLDPVGGSVSFYDTQVSLKPV